MKSDAEIAREYWERWSKDHFTCETISPNDNDIALVRAGREVVLHQVADGPRMCSYLNCECVRCWAMSQLEEIKDAA